jgi:hypothetical protein
MPTSEIESILSKVERLSADDKRLLIKRVVDLLGETGRNRQPHKKLQTRRPKTASRSRERRSALHETIAAYAARHGGGSDNVDLDPTLEAASLENWLNEDNVP